MLSERVRKLKRVFVDLYDQGFSPEEIAKECNVHVSTVYKYMPEIAKEAGRPVRDFRREYKPHLTYDRQFEPVAEIDVEQYMRKFEELKKSAEELSSLISQHIMELEKLEKEDTV